MNKRIKNIILITLLIFSQSYLAETVVVQSNIKKVTVFSLGASVTHTLKLSLPEGQHTIKLMDVSLFALSNSLQISDKDITVINAKLIKKLTEEEKKELEDKKESYTKQLEALEKVFSSNSLSAVEIKDLLAYYNDKIIELKKKIRIVEKQLQNDKDNGTKPYLEILIATSTKIDKTIELSYVNGSAAWVPEYEVFVSSINENLKLKYIAKIINKTGVNWNNVSISLSMNSPFDKTGEIPTLKANYIGNTNRHNRREEENNPEDNVKNPEAELDKLKIEGVDYEEYNAPSSSVLLSVKGAKSVPANGGVYKYNVFQEELPTNYVWYSFPGEEESSYLIGQVVNWKGKSIADGKVEVYYNGVNIGSSYLSIEDFPDTLDIPIGQNNEVVVKKTIIGDKTYTKESGNKIKETIAFLYTIKSNRKDKITVKIFDQIPVSQTNSAKVNLLEKSGATFDKSTGFLTWELSISNNEKTKTLIYYLEYDKWLKRSLLFSQHKRRRKTVRKYRAKF